MTGHGSASMHQDGLTVSIDLRSVNGRYFKLSLRGSDRVSSFTSSLEEVIRGSIRRGNVHAQLSMERSSRSEDYQIEPAAFLSYYRQVADLLKESGTEREVPIAAILALPGVVDETKHTAAAEEVEWPLVRQVLDEAIERLQEMRQTEGAAMFRDLEKNIGVIVKELSSISELAPRVVTYYRKKLEQRLAGLLQDQAVVAGEHEVGREVAIFADRCDISEEIVRLESHIDQFQTLLSADQSQGKKLEFLLQEMNREANTIASKANDSEIAQCVVEVKAALERMREMVQNIE